MKVISTALSAIAVGVAVTAFGGATVVVTDDAARAVGESSASGPSPVTDFAECGGPLAETPAEYAALFKTAGEKHGVDPQILAAIAKKESGFDPSARNAGSGASGMMQFMPGTARGLGIDPFDPAQAVDGAARLYKDYHAQFGSIPHALAAYNWGPGNLQRHGFDARPGETRDYVETITGWLRGATACVTDGAPAGSGPAPSAAVGKYMGWAESKVGGPYVFGGNGPVGFDCSSFVLTAMKQAGVNNMPRTAAAQRDWCAAGNCVKVGVNEALKGDIFFWDSYLGPNAVGHVGFVLDPVAKTTVDARSTKQGIIRGSYSHHGEKAIFEIWRPKL